MTAPLERADGIPARSRCTADNNICERALKRVVLHRKNALFYRTLHGADAGDLFMSLIHTCELKWRENGPFAKIRAGSFAKPLRECARAAPAPHNI